MSDVDDAKRAAWRAALAISRDNRNIASTAFQLAELAVLRAEVCALLAGGERRYWELVEQELRSGESPHDPR